MIKHVIIGVLLLVASSWSLFIPGINQGHDNNHMARIYEMSQGIREGSFPVIWSQNLNFGFGMPIFEFYAPLPYYFGALIYLLTSNLLLATKIMFFAANLITLIGIYILGWRLFKNKWATMVAAAAILLAPYRAVDLFVRTAVSESWAIAFLPFVLWGIIKIVNHERFGTTILWAALSCLVLSHNLTSAIAIPALIIFGLGVVWLQPTTSKSKLLSILRLVSAGIISAGITAFYILPVFAEKNLTQLDKYVLSSYYDYRQHFLYIRQFLKPWGSWEYGGSGWGPNDEMSFFLGYGQLLIILITVLQLIPSIIKSVSKKEKMNQVGKLQVLNLGLVGLTLLFTLLKTQLIWEKIFLLQYIQFPWRLLSISLLFIGLSGGFMIVALSRHRLQKYLSLFLVLLIVLVNFRYFRSEKYIDPSQELTNYTSHIRRVISTNLFDYVPININFLTKQGFYVNKNPNITDLIIPAESIISSKDSLISSVYKDQASHKELEISQQTASTISFNIAYYPGWVASIDGSNIPVIPDHHGLISLEVPGGTHSIKLMLTDTPIRHIGKTISLVSIVALFFYYVVSYFFQATHKPWVKRTRLITRRNA